MKSVRKALSACAEPIPQWLADWTPADSFDAASFFASRITYYPASGPDDWHAIQTLGVSGATHCFVHVDCGIPKEVIKDRLLQGIPSPTPIAMDSEWLDAKYGEDEVDYKMTEGWAQGHAPEHCPPYKVVGEIVDVPFEGLFSRCIVEPGLTPTGVGEVVAPYALFAVLQTDDHPFGVLPWPKRIALLFVAGDGLNTYDALFCQQGQVPAYALLIAAGMHEPFGQGSRLEASATQSGAMPIWQLAAEGYHWAGYEANPGVEGEPGGGGNLYRQLYRRSV